MGKTLRHLQVLSFMLQQYFERPALVRPDKIVTGVDIMNILHLKPGPQVGAILEAVAEAQVEGKISTRADALDFIKKIEVPLPKNKCS